MMYVSSAFFMVLAGFFIYVLPEIAAVAAGIAGGLLYWKKVSTDE